MFVHGVEKVAIKAVVLVTGGALISLPCDIIYDDAGPIWLITRCLHVANAPPHVTNTFSPTYEKLHKIRWMMEEMRDHFKAMWSPNQHLIVDEEMIIYKGKYCPIKQYMLYKLVRFGLKIWAAADAMLKYLWNFKVYCRKIRNLHDDEE